MADFPLARGGWYQESLLGASTADLGGPVVTANVSANTDGTAVALSTGMVVPVSGFYAHLQNNSAAAFYLIDLMASSGGTELVSDLLFQGARANESGGCGAYLPLALPYRTPLWARCRSATGSATITVLLTCVSTGFLAASGYSRCTTYGATPATSRGTTVTATGSAQGGNAPTYGSYAVLSTATTYPIKSLLLAVSAGALNVTARHLMHVAVGSAGNERIVIPHLPLITNTTSDLCLPNWYGPFDVDIAAASRLCVALTSTTASSALDVIAYGFD
jgi:hypothetical protein